MDILQQSTELYFEKGPQLGLSISQMSDSFEEDHTRVGESIIKIAGKVKSIVEIKVNCLLN